MSYGLIPVRLPFGPGCIGMPSTTYSGWVLALKDEAPRMRTAMPPSAVRLTARSEEHTSELQSQFHLVCRLLLEKKKQESIDQYHASHRLFENRPIHRDH